jgi:hypothetical protein
MDDPSVDDMDDMDDEVVPEGPGALFPGDEAAVALLRSNLGAVVIDSPSNG